MFGVFSGFHKKCSGKNLICSTYSPTHGADSYSLMYLNNLVCLFTKSITKGMKPIITKQRRREIINQSASISAALSLPK